MAGLQTTNIRMAVAGSKQPSTQMPAALVVAASCPLRSGGVLSQSLKAPSTRFTAVRRYYIGGHYAMRKRYVQFENPLKMIRYNLRSLPQTKNIKTRTYLFNNWR